MKIGIQTWGSEGDIYPFIALASGLSKAGHSVTLAVTSADRKNFKKISEQHGFKLGNVDFIGKSEEALNSLGKRMIEIANPVKQLRFIYEEMFTPGVDSMYETAQSLCANNDVVIGHFIHHPLQTAAEKASKPYITVTLNHGAIPTKYSPPGQFPNLGEWFNTILWKLSEKMINGVVLPIINDLRKKKDLTEIKSFRDVWESPLCNLIAVSPILCEPKKDWPAHYHVCGFFKMDDNSNKWAMPEHLESFLSEGPPPVYMTLGSMMGTENNSLVINETTRLLFDVAKQIGCRAVIQSRWEKVSEIPEDENIFRVNSAPYMKVFPKCKAVVHHGGAGTTQTATICGCPSIIIAHIQDQFLWGMELNRLGIGPKPLSRRTVSSKKIAREVRRVIENQVMSRNAQKIGEQLEDEEGVSNAVKIIERVMENRSMNA